MRLNENGEERLRNANGAKGKGRSESPNLRSPLSVTCFTLEQRIMARRAATGQEHVDNLLGVKFINFPLGDIRSISLL